MEDLATLLEPIVGPHLHDGPDIDSVRRRARRHRRRHQSRVVVASVVIASVALVSVLLVRGQGSSSSPQISPASPTGSSAATTAAPPTSVLSGAAAEQFFDDLPEFQALELPNGQIGYVESELFNERPPASSEATAFSEWLHTLVPVTAQRDSSSQLLGYAIRNYGFVDLATVQAPGFDIDTYLMSRGE